MALNRGFTASDALLRPSLVTRSLPRWPENDYAVRDVVSTTL
jgi:hypothetical protein